MDFSQFNKNLKQPEINQPKIDYQFIVVYDKKTKPAAKSLHNQAVNNKVKSTTWSKKEFLDQESRLTNYNHIVLLSETLIKENLGHPDLKSHPVIEGVTYKIQGHTIALQLEDSVDYVKLAKDLGNTLKEDWYKVAGAVIATGLIGAGIYTTFKMYTKTQKAKIYLLYRGIDKFVETSMMDFVNDKLK